MVVVNGLCEDVIWLLLTVLCLEDDDKELPEIYSQQTQQKDKAFFFGFTPPTFSYYKIYLQLIIIRVCLIYVCKSLSIQYITFGPFPQFLLTFLDVFKLRCKL